MSSKPSPLHEYEYEMRSLSPEARRRRAEMAPMHFAGAAGAATDQPGLFATLAKRVGPGTRVFEVARRTLVGTWQDGFIHAGNLAYLAMLALFPFFILGAALYELFGGRDLAVDMIQIIMTGLPPSAARVIAPVAEDAIYARTGWLLWLGAAVALWTVSSLVETIRDILRRAYGTRVMHAFWKTRLFSFGLILLTVVLLMVSLFAQVAIGTVQQVILAGFPRLSELIDVLRLGRIVPVIGVLTSLYMLFYWLTPAEYRAKRYPKWPGALFTAVWWLGVTTALPPILRSFFAYDLTYGSMAGIIIALFFFWLVGLGLVIGAELNAALAEPGSEESTEESE